MHACLVPCHLIQCWMIVNCIRMKVLAWNGKRYLNILYQMHPKMRSGTFCLGSNVTTALQSRQFRCFQGRRRNRQQQTRGSGPSSKNIERHPADTIVSWPNPKQWQMGHTSDLIMIIRRVIDISSRSPKLKWASSAHTAPHFAKKIRKVTERTNYILDALSTEYTQQAFTHSSRIFYRMCSMQVGKSA